jgi:hypothetical protein
MPRDHRYVQLKFSLALSVCLALVLNASLYKGQTQPHPELNKDVILTVDGEVEHSLKLTLGDLQGLTRLKSRVKDPDGTEAAFEGVPLIEILRLAGAKVGEQLRGKNLVNYLVVKAADGYQVVFALPELDPAFTDRLILLADHRDQKPLAAAEGPLRIVVPDEKRRARWVRQVLSLTIRRA